MVDYADTRFKDIQVKYESREENKLFKRTFYAIKK